MNSVKVSFELVLARDLMAEYKNQPASQETSGA